MGVWAEAVFPKCDLTDPASRKFLDVDIFGRDSFRGCGCFGRYTERLVTLEVSSGWLPDTYVGGTDS